MANTQDADRGHDLTQGVTLADFNGRQMLRGHVGKASVLLARVGEEVLAVDASCTHYGGALDQGLITEETVRCPLHHACFSLRTGEALGAPAFDPLSCWKVVRDSERIVVREKSATPPRKFPSTHEPRAIVIIGAGAAGFACAEMLRRRGYEGELTLLSADKDAPYDRPNLSKDYLAGDAPPEWMPLRPDEFYQKYDIDLQLGVSVSAIDVQARRVVLEGGRVLEFDRLLIATGAEPVRPPIPGADLPHVFTLRSFADGRALSAAAEKAKSAVVLGSGFIGLETAAALRQRGLNVHVVTLDARPLEKVLGPALGDFIAGLHEGHGVTFHMRTSIKTISANAVTLSSGAKIEADLVVMGAGVRPRTTLAEKAGLSVDNGVLVDERLQTSVPGIYAAGDVARWPGPQHTETMRVEHWVVAERQGQVVAANMLGDDSPFGDTPFFWSTHYDVTIRYVGHAEDWDVAAVDGDVSSCDASISYRRDGQTLAVATLGRDMEALTRRRHLPAAE
ncbi:FAD-dependent oxidoreductase [Nitratireductor mangrovi]|uniref:FAD-dependent oxidoreductase n=1 Tax=Nitratireductor mangrovi TaxID=2599600 RepID=A0A5B8KXB0_9HYPH|nr:FAD-dependent oxidoreductase [Nitratireductor mangrovi]QDZ00235.1 FAD-dependent oxidoreductase [Nitratireductor mangrovi]